MASSEAESTATTPKSSTIAQDPPPVTSSTPATPAYLDLSSFQACSPILPHGFFPSPMTSSPQAYPYMWGPQHTILPYGTPGHSYVVYSNAMLYPHPSLPAAAAPSGIEVNVKSPEGKEPSPLKNSKGSLGSLITITRNNINDLEKVASAAANGGFSQSGESGNEASSEGSDANSQNVKSGISDSRQDFYEGTPRNGKHAHSSPNGVPGTPQSRLSQPLPIMPIQAAGVSGGIAVPTINLNVEMSYWAATAPSLIPPTSAKAPGGAAGRSIVPGGTSDWIQDERELKRQRRKQLNRESARRSRLRKQAECDELAQRAEVLNAENATLIAELNEVRKEYDQLLSSNAALKEKLGKTPTGEALGLHRAVDESHPNPLDSDVQLGH